MKVDFAKFKGSLPYASELYGIYQPLLGWKSSRTRERVLDGIRATQDALISALAVRMNPRVEIRSAQLGELSYRIGRAVLGGTTGAALRSWQDTVVGQRVGAAIQANDADDPDTWRKYTSADALDEILASTEDEISTRYRQALAAREARSRIAVDSTEVLQRMLVRESIAAGTLFHLNRTLPPSKLRETLQKHSALIDVKRLHEFVDFIDPDRAGLTRAVLSPIGVVHLFRQYFFEFDTFLGSPVQHVWLSPGGSVELVEVSTRKTVIERTVEQLFDTVTKSEKSSLSEDEISDGVRTENASNTKLGVSADQTVNYGTAFINGATRVGMSFDIDQQQKEAREQTHRSLRQQTEKLSTEIRKSFKSTFKTVSETSDLQSRRYLLQNNTLELVNYELRRKMRQVGVQLQDYGTSLCWQTYVDEPGIELGIAQLVHIAQPQDLEPTKDPELIGQPEAELSAPAQSLSAEWIWEDSQYGFVPFLGQLQVVAPKPGFVFSRAQVTRVSGESWAYEVRPRDANDLMQDTKFAPQVEMIDAGDGTQERNVKSVLVGVQTAPGGLATDAHPTNTVQVTLYFKPSQKLLKDIAASNSAKIAEASAEKARKFQESLFTAARDRIKAARNVQPRPMSELREEERVVVYRTLIRQLIAASGVPIVDAKLQHVFAELVQSIFDVDRMLYFVAPEWWVPRAHPRNLAPTEAAHGSPQDVGLATNDLNTFKEKNVVSWGGAKEKRPDNYMITEDSAPAVLGSSLGWVLQLDGDNLRNAFLNAPWVKAVVPIREGQEFRAMDWLSSATIEGSEGLDALYDARDAAERTKVLNALRQHVWPEASVNTRYQSLAASELTIRDALRYLILRIQGKQAAAMTKPVDGAGETLGSLAIDGVFEHGFDPLQGGFVAQSDQPFRVFSQWIEVLPTDQIVPVQVTYDPKTGMQI